MKQTMIALCFACSALASFTSYIIGYSHGVNSASRFFPKDLIIEGGKAFSLNAPLLFGFPLAAAAALAALIFLLVSLFSEKSHFISPPHGIALLFLAPALVVFILFRWLSV